jgi:hypothetical protein
MSYPDPFKNFDKHFDNLDKRFDDALNRPTRTVAKWGGLVVLLNLLFWAVIIAMVVGGVLFLKAHGVF